MFDPDDVPPMTSEERLARFLLSSSHIRPSSGTVKLEAFMPHPHVELSLTRHRQTTDAEMWKEGARVASVRRANLHGRADIVTAVVLVEGLEVVPKPIPDNPNHADVLGWPAEKDAQKIKAILIAKAARLVMRPAS